MMKVNLKVIGFPLLYDALTSFTSWDHRDVNLRRPSGPRKGGDLMATSSKKKPKLSENLRPTEFSCFRTTGAGRIHSREFQSMGSVLASPETG